MRKVFLFCLILIGMTNGLMADDIVGFWKSLDDKTGKPQSIVAIYKYLHKFYGRLVVTYNDNGSVNDTIYNPKDRAPGVKGNPYYAGLDFIWNLKPDGKRYSDGKIMDPEKGRIYDSEMWTENGNLIVRGEFLFIGRNQTWPPATDKDFPPNFVKPDLTKLVPVIPKVNNR